MKLLRTDSNSKDFIKLVSSLDAELLIMDGEQHSFYEQYNTIDAIKHVIVLYENSIPVACGAIKKFDAKTMEIKRMYTLPEYRRKGYSSSILAELEKWTKELFYEKCVLETGLTQPEALQLYKKLGYQIIPNYDQYIGVENSRCFEKQL